MIYRNGLKEYSIVALIFGILMGAYTGLLKQSVIVGVIAGILEGLFFSFLIFLFCKFQEKKFDKMRAEISKERNVICDGGATVKGTGGWMFLTEYGIEFYPHKVNISHEELLIPLNRIKTVKTNKNKIVLETIEILTFIVLVSHSKEWEKQIQGALAMSSLFR